MKNNPTITNVPGILVGQSQTADKRSGCTVILCPKEGAVASYCCPGSAPGSRETDLLRPENTVQKIHGIVFSGGSAFGLAAADGVVQYLEENNIGHPTPMGTIPIVPAAVIYDLNLSTKIRPDKHLAYQAAKIASNKPVLQGNQGAGSGASSGKLAGFENSFKTGIGTHSFYYDTLIVGALSVVNALGNIVDWPENKILAGARKSDNSFYDWKDLYQFLDNLLPTSGGNSILSVIAVSAPLSKIDAYRVARLAQAGLHRAVRPSTLAYDGDIIFVISTAVTPPKSTDLIGTLAAEVLAQSILNSAYFAAPMGGLPGLNKN